eukprot:m.71293 g.71293  ORF g.71293 m.71293 type:complete len:90 (-) comp13809_c0_seq6:137-406(-)
MGSTDAARKMNTSQVQLSSIMRRPPLTVVLEKVEDDNRFVLVGLFFSWQEESDQCTDLQCVSSAQQQDLVTPPAILPRHLHLLLQSVRR